VTRFRGRATGSRVRTQMNAASTLPLHTARAMPVMGLGTWQLTHDTTGTVEEALHLGYRMIDTSGTTGPSRASVRQFAVAASIGETSSS
jgi:diketogulonate reductase-like aldo/keto reductase